MIACHWYSPTWSLNSSAALASTCSPMRRMHRVRLPPFTLCGDHQAEKLEAFRTAARPYAVVSQQIFDQLELGFPVESVTGGLQLLEQVSLSSLTVEQWHGCCPFLTPSPAVLCQCDAMPQLLDAGFAPGAGGQDDEDGQR